MKNNIDTAKTVLKLANIEYCTYSIPAIVFYNEKNKKIQEPVPGSQTIFQTSIEIDKILESAGVIFTKSDFTSEYMGARHYHYYLEDTEQ